MEIRTYHSERKNYSKHLLEECHLGIEIFSPPPSLFLFLSIAISRSLSPNLYFYSCNRDLHEPYIIELEGVIKPL